MLFGILLPFYPGVNYADEQKCVDPASPMEPSLPPEAYDKRDNSQPALHLQMT